MATYNKETFKRLFQSKFNLSKWQMLLQDYFHADKVLRAFPSKVQVTFQVGLSHFRQINADDFHIYVSYEELLRLGSDKYTVKIKNLPKGVSQVRFNPAQVDFLIEQVSPDYGD